MKCPLLQRYLIEEENEALEVFDDCLKEKCAWWIKDYNRCCILDGVLCLNILNDHLAEIVDQMPQRGK